MNLRFYDPERPAQFFGGGFGFGRLKNRNAFGHWRANFLKDSFALIFVYIHGLCSVLIHPPFGFSQTTPSLFSFS